MEPYNNEVNIMDMNIMFEVHHAELLLFLFIHLQYLYHFV